MNGANYDMAWSMAHFLAHGDGGRYQGAFTQFVKDIGRGKPWDMAWRTNFGSAEGFEKKWSEWWLAQEPLATKDLHVKAVVQTVDVSVLVPAKDESENLPLFMELAAAAFKTTPEPETIALFEQVRCDPASV